MQHPYPGAAVQDPEHWWRATRDAVQQIQNGIGAEINAIGLSGQMHGTVCLNSMRQLIRPALIWPDTRGTITAAELTAVVGEMRLSDTIGTPLASGFQGVTVAWLRQHEPTTWRSIATVLLPKDYLRFRLIDLRRVPLGERLLRGSCRLEPWRETASMAARSDRRTARLKPIAPVTQQGVQLCGEHHQPADDHEREQERGRDPECAVRVGATLDQPGRDVDVEHVHEQEAHAHQGSTGRRACTRRRDVAAAARPAATRRRSTR